MRFPTRVVLVCAGLALAEVTSAGDFVLTPNAGVVFGGDLDQATDGDERRTTFGLAAGYLGDGLLGFELDFTYTPDFFGGEDSGLPDNNLTTLMGNIVLSGRFGNDSRLYASGGAGLLKSRVDDPDDFFDVDSDDFGANAGAGIILALGDKAGIRGDVRYFRNLTGDDDEADVFGVGFGDFDYWRAAAGLTLRF